MKKILHYFHDYFSVIGKRQLLLVSLLTTVLIFCNYRFQIEDQISSLEFPRRYVLWILIFSIAWGMPYLLIFFNRRNNYDHSVLGLLLLAPPVFALKMTLRPSFEFNQDPIWNHYWNQVVYWPFLLLLLGSLLFLIGKIFRHDQLFFGSRIRGLDWKPYLWMLAFMVPLIAIAATQPDFQAMYPKLENIAGIFDEKEFGWWHKLVFELSYGTDFISIEFFFRGFLVLALAKYVGPQSILPMACFYCTIHFGKPLGECVSSYFGGMLLGVVVYNTRSIFGGLMVHLGIAWLMEIAGHLAK